MSDERSTDWGVPSGIAGKGFVVLGAGGGGMGTETSLTLARAGAKILCVDQNAAEAEAIARETGGSAHPADVTSRSDMERVFERADALFGKDFAGIVDIVGVSSYGPLAGVTDDVFSREFDIILRHALLAVQLGAPRLAARGGGAITLVGSTSGVGAVASQGMYGMAKAALHHLVYSAAQEFGPSGVRVNAVAPGPVQTPRVKAIVPEAMWKKVAAANPLRRTAFPADVSKTILFLCSDLASYLTSNVITLDGGVIHNIVMPE